MKAEKIEVILADFSYRMLEIFHGRKFSLFFDCLLVILGYCSCNGHTRNPQNFLQ